MKKPSLFAIFAHPDDEAFGPAGTLAKYAETHDVYLICATCGEAGENNADEQGMPLGEIRKEELRRSAAILGVEEVFFLGYQDGTLNNNQYHAIAEDIRKITDEYEPELFLTYENRGVSGHLDHVAMSMITHYVFHQVSYAKKLLSYVLLKDATDQLRNYFIYVPHGHAREDVDLVVNITEFWETKKEALLEHKSQTKDVNRRIGAMEESPKEEYFLVEEK